MPPSDASPISVKLLALSVDIILGKNVTEMSVKGHGEAAQAPDLDLGLGQGKGRAGDWGNPCSRGSVGFMLTHS